MGQVDTSGLSNLKSWVGALSRFGDSHGFYLQPWLSPKRLILKLS